MAAEARLVLVVLGLGAARSLLAAALVPGACRGRRPPPARRAHDLLGKVLMGAREVEVEACRSIPIQVEAGKRIPHRAVGVLARHIRCCRHLRLRRLDRLAAPPHDAHQPREEHAHAAQQGPPPARRTARLLRHEARVRLPLPGLQHVVRRRHRRRHRNLLRLGCRMKPSRMSCGSRAQRGLLPGHAEVGAQRLVQFVGLPQPWHGRFADGRVPSAHVGALRRPHRRGQRRLALWC
mmetsp:Transcript_94542/g.273308  ORF Transcript_94542/g.273308 Transcript_94542/m.273308 type:complete len:236 (-) Transcript_94542:649-1356(-)